MRFAKDISIFLGVMQFFLNVTLSAPIIGFVGS